jgi:hypothetical protein
MLRKLTGLMAMVLLLFVGVVMADEIKGKITKVDVDKKTMTVSVDGKETTYDVSDTVKMPKTKSKKTGEEKEQTLKGLAKQVENSKEGGVKAIVTTEKKSGKEVVTEVKYDKGKAKDKGDK